LNNSGTVTNLFSYDDGRLGTIQAAGWGSVMALDDTHPARVPTGATMMISNVSAQSFPLYLNAGLTGMPTNLPSDTAITVSWSGSAWVVNRNAGVNTGNATVLFTATPTSGMAPLTVQFISPFTDGAGTALTNWLWNFGDGSTSTAQNPTHTYNANGVFNPTFVATNLNGATVTGSGPAIHVNLPLLGRILNGGNLVLAWPTNATGCTLQCTTNLAFPVWQSVACSPATVGGQNVVTISNLSVPKIFFRLMQ